MSSGNNQQFEIEFQEKTGATLFVQGWTCPQPRSTIFVTHGLAEHSDCYQELADFLIAKKFNVLAWDLRGHGRSEGKRGYVENFDFFIDDYVFVLQSAAKQNLLSLKNFFAFGHSLGGLITLCSILRHPDLKPKGICLSSPACGIGIEVPAIKIAASKVAARVYPRLTLWNEIRYKDLVHSAEKIRAYDLDPLRHDKISPPLFLGMIDAQASVMAHAKELQVPLLMQVAGLERIVSNAKSAEVFEKAPSQDKSFKIYNDSLHEIYNDVEAHVVMNDLAVFLENHL